MSVGQHPAPVVDRARPTGAAAASPRSGHVAAAVVNGVLLWVTHQLLAWGWPGFLTDRFEQLLGIITLSFVVTIVLELVQVAWPAWRLGRLADVVTSAIAVVVGMRTWSVFPFDFSQYARDWSTLVRVVLVVAIVGAAVAVVVNLVRLVLGPPAARGARHA